MKQIHALNGDRSLRQIHGYWDEVAKKEAEWKGELDTKDPRANRADYQRFIAKSSLDGESHRGCFYRQPSEDVPADDPYLNEVLTTQALFAECALGFWTDALGRSYVTQEMTKLLADNGYDFPPCAQWWLRRLLQQYGEVGPTSSTLLSWMARPCWSQTFRVDLPVGSNW